MLKIAKQVLIAVTLLCSLATSVNAADDVPKRIDVPAGELTTALALLAKQAGVELIYQSAELAGMTTKGVSGNFTAREAVNKLLEGTSLTIRTDSSGAMLIGKPRGSQEKTAQGLDERGPSARKPDPVRLEGIVVTAQKRDEHAFDVPISIVAMGADELQKRKISSLDDLSLAVPGLQIASSGSHTRQIFMRGVSNLQGISSLVGMYLDEASVTTGSDSQLDLRAYDLARIEVLRGPQGTLYGEGSVGGTIRFITMDPVLDRFSTKADISTSFTQSGAPGQRVDGVVNVPLIQDELGLRIVGTFDRQGGWMDQPAAGRRDFNDQDLVNLRIKGLWQPTAQFSSSAMAVIHRNDAPRNVGEDANGNYTQTLNFTTTPSTKDEHEIYNFTASYDLAAMRILSTTTYINQAKETRNLGGRFQLIAPPAPRFEVHQPLQSLGNEVFSQELRLTSTDSRSLQWTAGAFYRGAEQQLTIPAIYFGLPGPPGTPLPTPFSVDHGTSSKSWAVFGDASYRVTDRLTLGAGLRHFRDEQEDTNAGVTQSARFQSLTPRAYAQYKVTDDVNTYASAAKGFRSGGFNAFGQPTFGPEEVWTYELGAKMSLLQGRLAAELAIFHSDYADYQIAGIIPPPAPPFGILSNAGKARIRGIEWALTWRPMDRWSLTFNGNYVDSKFLEIKAASSTYDAGDSLDYFPKYSFTVSAVRDFSWNGKKGFARVDYNKHGSATYRNRSIGPWYYSESGVIDMLNANVLLWWNDRLSLSVFAQNLLNERGFTAPNSIEEFAARTRPRTFGVGVGMTF